MTGRVLLLGGLDPSGGAGVTADALVVAAHGAHALPVVVALTAQNRHGFRSVRAVALADWRQALDAALGDGEVHAVKVGMLGTPETIPPLAAALRPLHGRMPIVVDPVLSATAGGYEAPARMAAAYREHLLPLASVFTPNAPEAEAILGCDPLATRGTGGAAILQKGGHGAGDVVEDVLTLAAGEIVRFRRRRLATGPVHGTGCALASAIAARLSQGVSVPAACDQAGDWLWRLLESMGPAPADGLPRTLPFWLAAAAPVSGTSPR